MSVEYNEGTNKRKETVETKATRHSEIHNQLIKPEPPFLPPTAKKYTLVLDLDETLVHYEDDGIVGQFYLRPFAPEFIEEMSKHYELVIFTAALQDYADWIIDRLDEKKRISHRLYRQHTSVSGNNYHIKVSPPQRRTSPNWAETSPKPSSSTTSPRTSSCRQRTAYSSSPGSKTPKTPRCTS